MTVIFVSCPNQFRGTMTTSNDSIPMTVDKKLLINLMSISTKFDDLGVPL